MTPRERKYHWKKAYIRKIERGLVPYPKIVQMIHICKHVSPLEYLNGELN